MTTASAGVFRSLRSRNYRLWAGGALVSNVGTWMQRTAQDWLVLAELTEQNASALGVVMALQFAPQFLFLPWTGYVADRFNQRKVLFATQAIMGALALALGMLTVTGSVALWHVYVFAFLFGSAAAFDAPVRQTFVAELVSDADLHNAIALNSTSFNGARMVGPAVAGMVTAAVGTGYTFLINGASFVAVLLSLTFLRSSDLRSNARASRKRGAFLEGLRYVGSRADLTAILVMLFFIGTFGLNFSIFISTMAVKEFQTGASGYGFLSSMMAVGTLIGAFGGAARAKPQFQWLLIGALVFGVGCSLAAIAPGYWQFGGALALIGVAALTFINTTNSLMLLSTESAMRGRVMALRIGITLGSTPIGAPIMGWVADTYGARWTLVLGALAGFAAAGVAVYALMRKFHLPKEQVTGPVEATGTSP